MFQNLRRRLYKWLWYVQCSGYQCTEQVHVVMGECMKCRRKRKDAFYVAAKKAREAYEAQEARETQEKRDEHKKMN